MRRIWSVVLVALIVAGYGLTMSPAQATLATCPSGADTWKAPVNGSWFDASKWSTGHVPDSTVNVCITVAGTYTVTARNDVSVKTLTMGGPSGQQTLAMLGLGCATNAQLTTSSFI